MDKNFLLLIPSRISRTSVIRYGDLINNRVYEAAQTNIPATLYVLDQLLDQKKKLDKILMICTNEVMDEIRIDSMTSFQYYKCTVSQALASNGYTLEEIDRIFAPIELNKNTIQSQTDVELLQNKVAEQLPIEGNLYIDFTGGMRSAAMVLVFLARFLEKRGMKIQNVLYSNILSDESLKAKKLDGQIESCQEIYECFNILDGMTAVELGKIEAMEDIAKNQEDSKVAAVIIETQKAMEKVSAGQHGAVKEEELKQEDIKGKGIRDQGILAAANAARKKMTAGSVIERYLKEGQIDAAARYIRESGVMELHNKGIITISSFWLEKRKEKISDAFFAYCKYYASYLKYMEAFLDTMDEAAAPPAEAFETFYLSRKTQKTNFKNFKTSEWLEREFNEHCADLVEEVEKQALEKILGATDMAGVRQGMKEYQDAHRSAIANYYSSGFPYGLIYGNNSYMKFGYLWLPEVFARKARHSVRRLKKNWKSCQLTELFPPAVVKLFFEPSASLHEREFAELLLLMDRIRGDVRNKLTHKDNADTEALEKMRSLLEAFDNLLKAHSS